MKILKKDVYVYATGGVRINIKYKDKNNKYRNEWMSMSECQKLEAMCNES